MMKPLILDNVSIAYGKNVIIKDCHFTIPQGRILSLLGSSGCGKSTLLKAIAGLLPVQTGKIELDGTVIAAPNHLLAPEKNKVGMIFQDYALFPHLTVLQNVAFGLHKLAAKTREKKAREGLALVRLSEFADRYPHELSGGQQQRVSIVRALVCEPTLLLFDEPFSNLDVSVRTVLMQDIRTLLKSRNITAIFVTHDRTESFTMADEIAIMRHGTIAQIGTPQQLYDAPIDREIAEFLGSGVILSAQQTADGWQTDLGLIPTADADKVIIWQSDKSTHVDSNSNDNNVGTNNANIDNVGTDNVGMNNADNVVYLRPRQIQITPDDGGEAIIAEKNFRGDFYVYQLKLANKSIELVSQTRLDVGTRVMLSFRL